jgi:hypothetical protein
MIGFVDKTQDQPPAALNQAFEVLRFLSRAGNLAAKRRLQDITHSCLHVWPDYTLGVDGQHPEHPNREPSSAPDSPSLGPRVNITGPDTTTSAIAPQLPPQYTVVAAEGRGHDRDESRLLETWMHLDSTNATFNMQMDWGLDLSIEAEGIYSSFYDPSLPLTGVDHLDWLEIEKVFNGQNDM